MEIGPETGQNGGNRAGKGRTRRWRPGPQRPGRQRRGLDERAERAARRVDRPKAQRGAAEAVVSRPDHDAERVPASQGVQQLHDRRVAVDPKPVEVHAPVAQRGLVPCGAQKLQCGGRAAGMGRCRVPDTDKAGNTEHRVIKFRKWRSSSLPMEQPARDVTRKANRTPVA